VPAHTPVLPVIMKKLMRGQELIKSVERVKLALEQVMEAQREEDV